MDRLQRSRRSASYRLLIGSRIEAVSKKLLVLASYLADMVTATVVNRGGMNAVNVNYNHLRSCKYRVCTSLARDMAELDPQV